MRPGSYEAICNPIGQAMVLDRDGTHFNIVFGLCVGHDTLFIKHSEAPVTCLVANDRVMAHNPIGALYCSNGYYKKALYEGQRGPRKEVAKMRWIAGILGLGLVAAPFVAGYSGDPVGLWWSVLLGAAVLVVAAYETASWSGDRAKYVAFVVGLIVVMTPTIPGFEGKTAAMGAHILLGGALMVTAAYQIAIR